MSGSILQEVQTSDGTGTTLSSLSVTLSNNATPGSVFHVFASGEAGSWVSGNGTFSDGTNIYTAIGAVHDTVGGARLAHAYVANNSTTGKTTITFTPNQPAPFLSIWVREIGGVKNQAPDGIATTFVTPATTTPSTTLSNTNQPAFMSALCSDQNVAQQPNVSGSLSLGARGWTFGTSTNGTTSAQESLTATGSQTAGFSLPSADSVTILAAMWDASTVGAALASNATAATSDTAALTTAIEMVGSASASSSAPAWLTDAAWLAWISQRIGPGMNITDGQVGGFTGPAVIALCGPEAPVGSIVQIFPLTGGTSGTLVINDCASLADASVDNQIFSLAYSEIAADVPININAAFTTGLVISSVPAGMMYAVFYDGPGGHGSIVIVHAET